MQDYDVIVIGSGLGGLSAAAILAKSGLKVLVLERQGVPGGYASSFVRGRFEFEIALHELSGLGNEDNKGPVWRILNECGVMPKLKFVHIPEFYRTVLPDLDITVPWGRESFELALCEHFPSQASGIRSFLATLFRFTEEALRAGRVGMKTVSENPSDFSVFLDNSKRSLVEVLNPLVSDENARIVLSEPTLYCVQPPSKCAFFNYALLVASYLRFGPAHIKGKSQALSQALVDATEENGGEVRFNKGVKRILTFRKGEVHGVVTEDGTEINSRYVICNVNPLNTCFELLTQDQVPGWYLSRLQNWSIGGSTFNVYLGLDCSCKQLGLETYENFVHYSTDLDKQHESMRHAINLEPQSVTLTAYNIADDEFSPHGTSCVVLIIYSYAEPWLKLRPREYFKTKHLLADKLIRLAERIAPRLKNHIEVAEIATPLTNIRYTGNPGGSIVGFDESYQSGTSQLNLPVRGPLPGLFFANAWVNFGGGFETCLATGYRAAKEILQEVGGGKNFIAIENLKVELASQVKGASKLKLSHLSLASKLLAKLHPTSISLKIIDVISETQTTKTLRMKATNGELPHFTAGQYISVVVEIDSVVTSRPYSISSAPGKPYYDITVRRKEKGFVSNYLLDMIRRGDTLQALGPFGTFYYEPIFDGSRLVFIAGGSGITPFMSIIRHVIQEHLPVNIHLLYGSRNSADIIFGEELKKITAKHANIKVDFVISEPESTWTGYSGLLDAKIISSLVGSVEGRKFFVCGPFEMHALCDGALKTLGVPLRNIKKETCGIPNDITSENGWPGISPDTEFYVVEERTGIKTTSRAGEPLITALERAKITVPSICRSGECTACRTRLISGKVFVPSRLSHQRWIDTSAGYIHPCVSYPLDNLRIRI